MILRLRVISLNRVGVLCIKLISNSVYTGVYTRQDLVSYGVGTLIYNWFVDKVICLQVEAADIDVSCQKLMVFFRLRDGCKLKPT